MLQIDPDVERRQVERVQRRPRLAERERLADARSTLSPAAARDGDNLVPPIIAAVEARATLGEISDAMRAVFGEHEEIDV